jgi:hypothetical protein
MPCLTSASVSGGGNDDDKDDNELVLFFGDILQICVSWACQKGLEKTNLAHLKGGVVYALADGDDRMLPR